MSYLCLCLFGKVAEREGVQDRKSSVCWFTLGMAGLGRSGIHGSGSPTQGRPEELLHDALSPRGVSRGWSGTVASGALLRCPPGGAQRHAPQRHSQVFRILAVQVFDTSPGVAHACVAAFPLRQPPLTSSQTDLGCCRWTSLQSC